MFARILTAIILILALLGVLFLLPPPVSLAAFGIFLLGGAWEWGGFMGNLARPKRIAYLVVAAMVLTAGHYLVANAIDVRYVLLVAVALWLLTLLPLMRFPFGVPATIVGSAGLAAHLFAWLALTHILVDRPQGTYWLLLLFLLVWAADIGAFFVGSTLGRHKLAPAVSPKKTWEGVAGGLIAAALMAAAGAVILDVRLTLFVPFALLVAALSIIGDLTVSLFKRNAGLKDSGNVFPGHGGILDRVDSLIAAAPLFALGMDWFGAGT